MLPQRPPLLPFAPPPPASWWARTAACTKALAGASRAPTRLGTMTSAWGWPSWATSGVRSGHGAGVLGVGPHVATLPSLAMPLAHFSLKRRRSPGGSPGAHVPGSTRPRIRAISPQSRAQGKHVARENTMFCTLCCFYGSVSKCSLFLGNHGNTLAGHRRLSRQSRGWSGGACVCCAAVPSKLSGRNARKLVFSLRLAATGSVILLAVVVGGGGGRGRQTSGR